MQNDGRILEALPSECSIGREYTILNVLGQGGFGITYIAQNNLNGERVVIKENLPTQMACRDSGNLYVRPRHGEKENYEWARSRFLAEARLLHSLHHPNIVRVTRAFSALNTAYYVMPWIGGTDLEAAVAADPGRTSEVALLAVLRPLLQALQYLHENNLLHRDIKPENILISESGVPVLIDFGAARAMVSERSQTLLESPGYTPFEQLQSHGNVGPWTDIYSLGATLYRLIIGAHPPRSSDRIGQKDTYQPLATRPELSKHYSGTFLRSIDKALSLWPAKRWQSAEQWENSLSAIAEDRPPAGQHKPATSSPKEQAPPTAAPHHLLRNSLIATAVLMPTIGAGYATYRHLQNRTPQVPPSQEQSATTGEKAKHPPIDYSFREKPRLLCRLKLNSQITCLAISPDGQYLAVGRKDSTIRLAKIDTERQIVLIKHNGLITAIAFSPDGQYIASGSLDFCTYVTNLVCPDERKNYSRAHFSDLAVAFSPDGKYLAAGGTDNTARVIERESGKELLTIQHSGAVTSLAFSPDSKSLMTGSRDASARITALDSKSALCTTQHKAAVQCVAFSPNGRYAATGTKDGTIQIIDITTGKTIKVLHQETEIRAVAFTPNGQYLAWGGSGQAVLLTDIHTGEERLKLVYNGDITSISFSSDGRRIAIGGQNEAADVYELK